MLTLLAASSIPFIPPASDLSGLIAWVPYVVVVPLLATIAFVVPLTGVHRALVDQRAQLEDAAQGRLKTALEDMAHEVDAGDLSRPDAWNKTLLNLQIGGTIMARLPTWPAEKRERRPVVGLGPLEGCLQVDVGGPRSCWVSL